MYPDNIKREWHGKPYYSLDSYCKNTFHHKCYKIALNARMSCPNRDGTLGTRGCIFCSRGGSGDFAVDMAGKSMQEQLTEGMAKFGSRSSTSMPRQSGLVAMEIPHTSGWSRAERYTSSR